MLDTYFKRPLLWDYVVSTIAASLACYFVVSGYLTVPTEDHLFSTVSDIATVALTMAGFILTLLTVLISFKSSNTVDKDEVKDTDKVFDIFFASQLYFKTVVILKNAIKSLTVIALVGYLLKLFLTTETYDYLFVYCVFSVFVILMTLWRSVLILARIVEMQQSD